MEREKIIKALDSFHKRILETDLAEKIYETEIMAIIDALSIIKELTEENENYKSVAEYQQSSNMSRWFELREKDRENNRLIREIDRLTKENKRIKLEYAGFQAGAKHAVLFVKVNTVKKMQERLNDRIKDKLAYHGWYIKETIIPEVAKELSEETNERK